MSLWIPFAAGDNGQGRPDPGDPWNFAQEWWNSPDLVPTVGGSEVARIRPGRSYGIRARVSNDSSNAVANVKVQVWACRHGMTPVLPPLGEFELTGTVPGETAAGFGVGVFDTSPAETWTAPGDSEHVCLLGNCYVAGQGSKLDSPLKLDVIHQARHGQNNLAFGVWPVLPKPETHALELWAATLGRKRHTYALELVDVSRNLSFVDVQQVFATPWAQALADHRSGKRRGRLTLADFPLVPIENLKLEAGKKSGGIRSPIKVEIEPDDPLQVVVNYEVPAARRPSWHVFDVVQRDPEDGAAIGGARLMVLNLPAAVIEEIDERDDAAAGHETT